MGRHHRVETISASFLRESQASLPGSVMRSAVKIEKDKVTWMEPPVIKETIIEATLDEEKEIVIDKVTHKTKRKIVKKKPAMPHAEEEPIVPKAREHRPTTGHRQPLHQEEPWTVKIQGRYLLRGVRRRNYDFLKRGLKEKETWEVDIDDGYQLVE